MVECLAKWWRQTLNRVGKVHVDLRVQLGLERTCTVGGATVTVH